MKMKKISIILAATISLMTLIPINSFAAEISDELYQKYDFNSDELINGDDIFLIIRFLSGLIKSGFCRWIKMLILHLQILLRPLFCDKNGQKKNNDAGVSKKAGTSACTASPVPHHLRPYSNFDHDHHHCPFCSPAFCMYCDPV